MNERLYNTAQVADMLGVGVHWVRRRVADKAIPHVRLGRVIRFSEDHVKAIIDAHTVGEDTAAPLPRRARQRPKFPAA